MKLNFAKKLVLVLHWLTSVLLLAFTALRCIAPQVIDDAVLMLNSALGAWLASVVGVAALAICALFAVLAAFALFGGRGKRSERGFITVDSSDAGRTRIAIGAVDQMIRQAVRGVEGITDMKSGIVNNTDAISINCSVAIANGAHVPTVTMNIQRAIRSYIELNCGVAVREVSVSVHALDSGEGKGRKKGKNASTPAAPVYVPEPVQETAPEPQIAAEPDPAPAAPEAEAENSLPEIEPITLTLDPPAEAEEAPAEECQNEE